jgi:DNA-binding transcriptional LysR family regulator
MKTATAGTKGYRRLIPSVTALVEFESVARLSSFTVAANELGVTQAAVSRQVKFLEEALGIRLFHRLHRSIELTEEGEALYLVVAESMQKIAGVFDRCLDCDEHPRQTSRRNHARRHSGPGVRAWHVLAVHRDVC